MRLLLFILLWGVVEGRAQPARHSDYNNWHISTSNEAFIQFPLNARDIPQEAKRMLRDMTILLKESKQKLFIAYNGSECCVDCKGLKGSQQVSLVVDHLKKIGFDMSRVIFQLEGNQHIYNKRTVLIRFARPEDEIVCTGIPLPFPNIRKE